MITPLFTLAILFTPALICWLFGFKGGFARGALYGLAAAFAFFAIGHFAQTDGMTQMMPHWVPFARQLVYATGVLEFTVAIALMIPRTRRLAGLAAVAILISFFPVNVWAAFQYVDFGGHAWGPVYLFLRTPLQIILLFWAWRFVISDRERRG